MSLINLEAWEWYYHGGGDGRCPIVDTWWQTETWVAILIARSLLPLGGASQVQPAGATKPLFASAGAGIVDAHGQVGAGWPPAVRWCIGDCWPGQYAHRLAA